MDDPIFYTKRARDGTRTRDLHLGKVALHQLKSARRDSNPRPPPWQGGAPPTEPLAQFAGFFELREKNGNTLHQLYINFKSSFPNDNSHSIGYVPISQAK